MNLPNPQGFSRSFSRRRAGRTFTALALTTVLVAATSVQAGPVTINQVVQTLSRNQGPANLKTDLVSQDPAGAKGSNGAPKTDGPIAPPVSGGAPKLDGLLSSITVAQGPQDGVEVIEEAEVEGTICDCGDLLVPVAGIPKWPLLLLAAVPLVFIHDCTSCDDTPESTPTPTPTPNPTQNSTPTPTPEPASLLLFGTGLAAVGAGLRRRYAKSKE